MATKIAINPEMKQAYVDYATSVIVSKTYDYEGNAVPMTRTKNGIVYVNLTEVAKAFPNKNLTQIVNSQEIKEYCESLSKLQNYSLADLLIVKRGGNDNGTWAHQKIALRVGQKLSSDFAVWVDSRIEELLQVGMTATPATLEEMVDNPDLVIEMATRLKQLRAENAEKQRKIEADAPKVEFHDKITASDDTCLVRELAKVLTQRGFKIGQNRLYELLRNEGYLIKHGSDRNSPTQPYVDSGIFEVDRKPWTNPKTGEVHIGKTSKVTSKGLKYFIGKFLGRAAVL